MLSTFELFKKINKSISLSVNFKEIFSSEINLEFLSILYFPIEIPDDHNRPHVDQDYPHTVLLYYINDSDGDTYFFKKKKIIDRVTPKQNRLVIFDGTTHHASSNPSKGHRISLNLNYKI